MKDKKPRTKDKENPANQANYKDYRDNIYDFKEKPTSSIYKPNVISNFLGNKSLYSVSRQKNQLEFFTNLMSHEKKLLFKMKASFTNNNSYKSSESYYTSNNSNSNSNVNIFSPTNKSSKNQLKAKLSHQFSSVIQKTLSKKYFFSKKDLDLINLDKLIFNRNCHLASLLKEYMILDFIDEFLKREYKLCESVERIPKFANYYKNYLKFFCNPSFRDLKANCMIQDYGDNKAELYYNRNYGGRRKPDAKKGINNVDLNNIFNSTIKKNIERNSLTQTQNTIRHDLLSESNIVSNVISNNVTGLGLGICSKKLIIDTQQQMSNSSCLILDNSQVLNKSGLITYRSKEESILNILYNMENGENFNVNFNNEKLSHTQVRAKTSSACELAKTISNFNIKDNNTNCNDAYRNQKNLLTTLSVSRNKQIKFNEEKIIKEFEQNIIGAGVDTWNGLGAGNYNATMSTIKVPGQMIETLTVASNMNTLTINNMNNTISPVVSKRNNNQTPNNANNALHNQNNFKIFNTLTQSHPKDKQLRNTTPRILRDNNTNNLCINNNINNPCINNYLNKDKIKTVKNITKNSPRNNTIINRLNDFKNLKLNKPDNFNSNENNARVGNEQVNPNLNPNNNPNNISNNNPNSNPLLNSHNTFNPHLTHNIIHQKNVYSTEINGYEKMSINNNGKIERIETANNNLNNNFNTATQSTSITHEDNKIKFKKIKQEQVKSSNGSMKLNMKNVNIYESLNNNNNFVNNQLNNNNNYNTNKANNKIFTSSQADNNKSSPSTSINALNDIMKITLSLYMDKSSRNNHVLSQASTGALMQSPNSNTVNLLDTGRKQPSNTTIINKVGNINNFNINITGTASNEGLQLRNLLGNELSHSNLNSLLEKNKNLSRNKNNSLYKAPSNPQIKSSKHDEGDLLRGSLIGKDNFLHKSTSIRPNSLKGIVDMKMYTTTKSYLNTKLNLKNLNNMNIKSGKEIKSVKDYNTATTTKNNDSGKHYSDSKSPFKFQPDLTSRNLVIGNNNNNINSKMMFSTNAYINTNSNNANLTNNNNTYNTTSNTSQNEKRIQKIKAIQNINGNNNNNKNNLNSNSNNVNNFKNSGIVNRENNITNNTNSNNIGGNYSSSNANANANANANNNVKSANKIMNMYQTSNNINKKYQISIKK